MHKSSMNLKLSQLEYRSPNEMCGGLDPIEKTQNIVAVNSKYTRKSPKSPKQQNSKTEYNENEYAIKFPAINNYSSNNNEISAVQEDQEDIKYESLSEEGGPWGDDTKKSNQESHLKFPRIRKRWLPIQKSTVPQAQWEMESMMKMTLKSNDGRHRYRNYGPPKMPNPILLPIEYAEKMNKRDKVSKQKISKTSKHSMPQESKSRYSGSSFSDTFREQNSK